MKTITKTKNLNLLILNIILVTKKHQNQNDSGITSKVFANAKHNLPLTLSNIIDMINWNIKLNIEKPYYQKTMKICT